MACEVSPVAMFCKMVSSESDGHLSQWWWTGVDGKLRWPRTPIIPPPPSMDQSGYNLEITFSPIAILSNEFKIILYVQINPTSHTSGPLSSSTWGANLPIYWKDIVGLHCTMGKLKNGVVNWSTLKNYFSMDIDPKFLHIAPSTPQKHNDLRQIFVQI